MTKRYVNGIMSNPQLRAAPKPNFFEISTTSSSTFLGENPDMAYEGKLARVLHDVNLIYPFQFASFPASSSAPRLRLPANEQRR